MRSYLCDRVLDSLHPAFRISLLVTCIVKRQDFSFQQAVDCSSIQLILVFLILVSTFFSQCPSGSFTVTFQPPSVKYRQVYNTVHQSFFTGSTGSFQRTSRSVHPDIYTRNQTTSQFHIVIFKENDLTKEFRTVRDFHNLLDQTLTGTIVGMSLTCKQELYRVIRIVHDLGQTIQVCEQQMCTLVSSKTTCETDQQCVRIDLVHQRNHTRRITLVLQPCITELVTDIVDQLVLQSYTSLPNFFIGYIVDSFPDLFI